eukprot:TRINITY_DN864_c0_g1_i2.p1 TRINITY_DN864_c0_g1~~TRINITY_DN864_c0_g1_i2.p1  ORF type:complete len:145 (+),score=39.59 TRINITY_DN864_c0_g1_i2:168-602(+)
MVQMDLCGYKDACADFVVAIRLGGELGDEYLGRYEEAVKLEQASHFYWLGLPEEAIEADEIKKAYKKQCMKWHPDKNQKSLEDQARAANMFQRVSEAYEIISDPVKRVLYRNKQHEAESLKFARSWSQFGSAGMRFEDYYSEAF